MELVSSSHETKSDRENIDTCVTVLEKRIGMLSATIRAPSSQLKAPSYEEAGIGGLIPYPLSLRHYF